MEIQAAIDKNSKDYIDLCYKEYTRLATQQEAHLHSAFSDLKLLSAIGGMLAWDPILNALTDRTDPLLLVLGFLAILFVALFIFLFDFMKQSIMLFYTDQMKFYEREIQSLLEVKPGTLFNCVDNWSKWMKKIHEPIAHRFFLCFSVFVIGFPLAVIATATDGFTYLFSYAVVATVACALSIQCLHIITKKITQQLES